MPVFEKTNSNFVEFFGVWEKKKFLIFKMNYYFVAFVADNGEESSRPNASATSETGSLDFHPRIV